LYSNDSTGTGLGSYNSAFGAFALVNNTDGEANSAFGTGAMEFNQTGRDNVAVGTGALSSNRTGGSNTAIGTDALEFGQSGSGNTAVGLGAGILATGSNNVYIGAGMSGVAGESNACYIASIFGQTSVSGIPVLINSSNKLGTATSSKRFKEDIKPMEKTSEALYALKPVSFRYKKEIDPAGTSQLGLVAEDVEKVDPDLVVRDKDGRAYTVRYDQVNAMLLNEFLKEHKAFLEEQRKVQRLEAALDTVNQRLKEQEEKIERVSSQVETSRPALQVVQVP
jgi:hypothetical protein